MKLGQVRIPKPIRHVVPINPGKNYIKALKVGVFIIIVRAIRNMLKGMRVSVSLLDDL